MDKLSKESTGSWIIHHGRKVVLVEGGGANYPTIEHSAKAAHLLNKLSASDQDSLTMSQVEHLAKSAGLNTIVELPYYLNLLQDNKLIDKTDSGVETLGLTTRAVLGHTTDIFYQKEASQEEMASISLAEMASDTPVKESAAKEYIGDTHSMSSTEVSDFLDRAKHYGFIDAEGEQNNQVIFNGNLFRKDNILKASAILSALTEADQRKITELNQLLESTGCLEYTRAATILGDQLFDKAKAAGLYDLNVVSNNQGEHVYLTSPGAFHKFIDPMVDDTFDMAKALVAALSYGMSRRSSSTGRIRDVSALLRKLINGGTVGPTTAIGQDYRVLEIDRVVKTIPEGGLFRLRLLKKDVGELALQVLTTGTASEAPLTLPNAPMTNYTGPEANRTVVRKKQSVQSKKETLDIINSLREGRQFDA